MITLFVVATFVGMLTSLFFLFRVMLIPSTRWSGLERLDGHLRELEMFENHRNRIVAQLRDLELDHTMNKVSDDDYSSQKERLERQGVVILKKIDQCLGGKHWDNRIDTFIRNKLPVLESNAARASSESSASQSGDSSPTQSL